MLWVVPMQMFYSLKYSHEKPFFFCSLFLNAGVNELCAKEIHKNIN